MRYEHANSPSFDQFIREFPMALDPTRMFTADRSPDMPPISAEFLHEVADLIRTPHLELIGGR